MTSRVTSRVFASIAAVASTLALSSCSFDSETAQNAVAVGGEFEFHSPGGKTEIFYEPEEREQISTFSGESLIEEGKDISLDDYDGQIVVLNAWGQWCAPCRSEVDDLQAVHEYLQEKQLGTVLGINVRDPNPVPARDFVTDSGVTFPSIYDPPFRTALYLGGVPSSVIPTTIVLDAQHRPAAVFLREISAEELTQVIDDLTKEA